jgi:hypothetical protein
VLRLCALRATTVFSLFFFKRMEEPGLVAEEGRECGRGVGCKCSEFRVQGLGFKGLVFSFLSFLKEWRNQGLQVLRASM